jgi:hypothetical protein
MLYMVTFTINIHQMLAYIPYMDPMGYVHHPEVDYLRPREHLIRPYLSAGDGQIAEPQKRPNGQYPPSV